MREIDSRMEVMMILVSAFDGRKSRKTLRIAISHLYVKSPKVKYEQGRTI